MENAPRARAVWHRRNPSVKVIGLHRPHRRLLHPRLLKEITMLVVRDRLQTPLHVRDRLQTPPHTRDKLRTRRGRDKLHVRYKLQMLVALWHCCIKTQHAIKRRRRRDRRRLLRQSGMHGHAMLKLHKFAPKKSK